MPNLSYITPSILPSKTANSVHVMLQCDAMAELGYSIRVFAKRTISDESKLKPTLKKQYGINTERLDLHTYYSAFNRFNVLFIAIYATAEILIKRNKDIIFSRNLYAAFFLAVIFRRKLLFETHQLELGLRKHLQRSIVKQATVKTIVISNKLQQLLGKYLSVNPSNWHVLHDAAPSGIEKLIPCERRQILCNILPKANTNWSAICGYFGQLHMGRGIEIIEELASLKPDVLFLVYGGNQSEVKLRKYKNINITNIYFGGHLPHIDIQLIMKSVDILLMPYQRSVSIGLPKHDTARWMSPMKMFEYMASGVPLISSDLPVLREVLRDGENSLLVLPDNILEWLSSINKLILNPEFAEEISSKAHSEYESIYTWSKRAQSIFNLV
jgi:glycosyltransferase involved in cell wall biosynthesis